MGDNQHSTSLASFGLQNTHEAFKTGCIECIVNFVADKQIDVFTRPVTNQILQCQRTRNANLPLLTTREGLERLT